MRRWKIGEEPTALQLHEIAQSLRAGSIVLMPTDTIYGLHAMALDEDAVGRVGEIKGREETKPFVVLAASVEQLADLGISAGADLLRRLASIWPAPLTAILPLVRPIAASRGAESLAVRVPDVDWIRDLLGRTGPLVSTSANRSGEPPATSPDEVARALQGVDAVVDGGVREGEPSAILDLTSAEPRFIRERDSSFAQKVWKRLRNTL